MSRPDANDVLDRALSYVARGWPVVHIKHRAKRPDGGKDWPKKATTNKEEVKRLFNGDGRHNVGVPMGNGLCDVDLDCPEALATAGYFLPETGVVFGRASSRAAHRIYRSDAAEIIGKAVQDWEDPEHPGKPMLELRVGGGGKAAQTVFPGSIHESGEPIEFEPGFYREPAEVDGADLIRACQETAAASLVARAWPTGGGHRPALVIGGFLARAGWSAPRVDLFVRAVMAHVKGEHASDHARAARNAAEAHANGDTAFGFPALKETFGEKRAKRIAEWLEYDASGEAAAAVHVADAPAGGAAAVTIDDFYAYLPEKNKFVFTPTGDLWPMESVDTVLGPVTQKSEYKGRGRRTIKASTWLARNRAVLQMTWAPGKPQIIEDVLVAEGGFTPRPGARILNLYRPPTIKLGDPEKAAPWLAHLRRLYPADADHLLKWFAHRAQRPWEKVNHAIVLGGGQGIGKDTLLEGVAHAIGPWNMQEIGPSQIMGDFNPYAKGVILRISEAHDTGDENRFKLYERTKTLTAAPPDTISVNEKHKKPYRIPNVVGAIYTTNHVEDALYIPDEDRRHFLAGSDVVKEDFTEAYWVDFWDWYTKQGGLNHVAALLHSLDLSSFNPKAPPPKTEAFRKAVSLGRPETDGVLMDLIEAVGQYTEHGIVLPAAITREMLTTKADEGTKMWLSDQKNRKAFSKGTERCGYVAVDNPATAEGLWSVNGKRQIIYASVRISPSDRKAAAEHLANRGTVHSLREWVAQRGLNRLLKVASKEGL